MVSHRLLSYLGFQILTHSYTYGPQTAPTTHTQPIAALVGEPALRRPAEVVDLIVTRPGGDWCSCTVCTRRCCLGAAVGPALSVEQVPYQYHRIIGTRSKGAASVGRPFNTVDGCLVAAELEECLAGLADIEDANHGGVGGKGGEEMSVMRGSSEAEKGLGLDK